MIRSLIKLLRPAAAVTALVVVGGVVQAAPAAAAPDDPRYAAISITAHVSYPDDDASPGYPGTDIDHPADAGHAPGSVTVSYEFTNVGTDALMYFYRGYVVPLTVGHLDDYECETAPVFPPDDWELQPTQTVHCTASISQIPAGVVLEVEIGVSGLGVNPRQDADDSTRVWVQVDAPAPPPPTPPTSVGHLVYVDTNHDGHHDAGEAGLPGARLSLRGPDGKPVQGVSEQTTDAQGRYSFDHLSPGGPYTVTLDLASLDLTNRTPTSFTNGSWEPGDTRWSLSTTSADSWDSIDFGFFPKIPVLVDQFGEPQTRVVGLTYVGARLRWVPFAPEEWDGPAIVEYRAGGTTTWTKFADLGTPDQWGYRQGSGTLKRSGWLRVRTKANRFFASGLSKEVHVTVTTAPVLLYAQAPATVKRGEPLTVTGSITRSYYRFATGRILLERSTDGTTWTTVADLRSTKEGLLTATVDPAVSGSYRFRYLGDSGNSPATSPTRRVVVVDAARKASTPPSRR